MYKDVIILLGLLPNIMGRHLVYILLFLRTGFVAEFRGENWLAWGMGIRVS